MSSAEVKLVRPLLLKISALIVPMDDCTRTVGINAIAKVSLPLKLKFLVDALSYILPFYGHFISFLALEINYYSKRDA